MASLSFAITSSLPACPGAWPVTEPPSPTDRVATRNRRVPYSARPSPKRKQNLQPLKQTTLERNKWNGTTTWKLSSYPIPPGSKRRAYSASSPSQKGKQNLHHVLKQTTIKQCARNGHPSLSLQDVNELCKALARCSLSELRSSYNRFRSPIYKAYRKRPSTCSPLYRGRAYLSTPESSGPPQPPIPRDIATPNRSPLSTSPFSLRDGQDGRRKYSDRASNLHRISSPSPSPSSVESSPCPPGPRRSRKPAPTDEPVNKRTAQRNGISRHIDLELQPEMVHVRVSPNSAFTRHHRYPQTPNTIDNYIATRLLDGPKVISSGDDKDMAPNYDSRGRILEDKSIGFIYVASRPTSKGFVKIGQTVDIDRRLKQISKRGAYGDLKRHDHCRQRKFRHFTHAETIIMAELHNIRYVSDYKPTPREGKSPPGDESGHTEWFNTNHEHANKVVSKWREWFDSEPYHKNGGKLVGFWRKKIKNRETYDETKHGDLHARWSELLEQPTKAQLRRFQVAQALEVAGSIMSSAFKFLHSTKGVYFVLVVAIYYYLVGSLSFGVTGLVFGLFLVSGLVK